MSNISRTSLHVFVFSSPSGGGKNTVICRVTEADRDLEYVISATTRNPRKGERDGRHYYFLKEDLFLERAKRGEFIEYANVHGYYYGTLWSEVNRVLDNRRHVIMDIDIQGALSMREKINNSVLIFLLPPSLKTLENRLVRRGTDSPEEIQKRLINARKEMKYADRYDFQVINEELDTAVNDINAIIARYKTKKKEY